MARIAIDALGITQPGGGRSATLNLLLPLLEMDAENEYLVFLDEEEQGVSDRPNVRAVLAPTRQRFAVRAWAQATWPALLRREGADVMHHTKNLITFWNPCPTVVTIHDLTILVHPDIYPLTDVLYWRTLERWSVNACDRVIAVSDVTANDLVDYYDTPPERISTIFEGIDDGFRPAPPSEVDRVRARYGLPHRYLLHVGSISPKKNLATLARAYGHLMREGGYDGGLVLVGRNYWAGGDAALDDFIEEQAGDDVCVLRTGPVPQSDLAPLYTGADCFCFPSLHEGFGLVPLEAAACGTPVVSSRAGVMDRLLEGVALFLDDPTDDNALAVAIANVIGDPRRREVMREAGLAEAPRWSRRRAAQETLHLYLELV